jgi:hypothetical protein
VSAEAWAAGIIDMRAQSRQHCALAASRWWRRHARESANAGEALRYAENMELLAGDIAAHPGYYRQRPDNLTDWQWFQARTAA